MNTREQRSGRARHVLAPWTRVWGCTQHLPRQQERVPLARTMEPDTQRRQPASQTFQPVGQSSGRGAGRHRVACVDACLPSQSKVKVGTANQPISPARRRKLRQGRGETQGNLCWRMSAVSNLANRNQLKQTATKQQSKSKRTLQSNKRASGEPTPTTRARATRA